MATKSRTPRSNFDRTAERVPLLSAKPHTALSMSSERILFFCLWSVRATVASPRKRVAKGAKINTKVDYQHLVVGFLLEGKRSLSLCPFRLLAAAVSIRAASLESNINELPLEIPIINAAHFIGSGKSFRAEIKLELERR